MNKITFLKRTIAVISVMAVVLAVYAYAGAGETAPLAVKRVDIKAQPEKSEYLIGEELDLSDTYLEITYENGVKEDVKVTPDMIEGFDNTTVGVKLLTVNYGNKSAAYSVWIVEEYTKETETERETIDFDPTPATSEAVSETATGSKTVVITAIIATVIVLALILTFIMRGKKRGEDEL